MSDKKIKKMVGLSIFTAIVVVLQLLGSFIKIGTFSFSRVLIPIVVGAAVYGPGAGAFLGGVFGAVVTIACANGSDYGGSILFTANPFLTIFICMLKGILAGAAAGGVYNLAAKKNVYLGVFLAAVAAPVVNTGLFCLSLELFFRSILVDWAGGKDLVYYIFVVLVGVNFLLGAGSQCGLQSGYFPDYQAGSEILNCTRYAPRKAMCCRGALTAVTLFVFVRLLTFVHRCAIGKRKQQTCGMWEGMTCRRINML